MALAPSFDGRPGLTLVLGLDKKAPAFENPFRFPCTAILDKAYCNIAQFKFENEQCERSIWVDRIASRMEISCMIKLRKIVLAVTEQQARIHQPQSQFDYYPLQFTNAVRLRQNKKSEFLYEILVLTK